MSIYPTGEQFQISHGRFGAVVTEVGSALRSLTVDGAETLWTFAEDEVPKGSAGQQLVPWPNRIRDGRYSHDGQVHQLNISEVPREAALHGLAGSVAWDKVSHEADAVSLATTIYPQNGWPGVLRVQVTHRLSDDGLTVEVTAENVGSVAVPYGYGAHPYFAAPLAETTLHVPFTKELFVDERLLPRALSKVTEEFDFRDPRPLGDTTFDTAFTDPINAWEIHLVTPERSLTMWADETIRWAQIYTLPTREAIALEPMTCGPDAFNEGPTHSGVIDLAPGDRTTSVWGVRFDQ